LKLLYSLQGSTMSTDIQKLPLLRVSQNINGQARCWCSHHRRLKKQLQHSTVLHGAC